MSYCSICGKSSDQNDKYHKTCLKRLFGIDYVPAINFSLPEISIKAQQTAGKLSISGVQPKLSVRLNKKSREIEVTPEHGEYILKPQTQVFGHLPENENLCMLIAECAGITVPPHGLFELNDGTKTYIIKRYDRNKGEKIHQENFYQILESKDKYKGSLEAIGTKLKEISDAPGLDVQLYYERVLFNFLIGNGDAHSKNFSVVYDKEGRCRLAPAYDIVCSKLVIPDEEDFALTMGGKKNKLIGRDFADFARYLGIPGKVYKDKFLKDEEMFISLIRNSEFPTDDKTKIETIVKERFIRIGKIWTDKND
ncbi:MAG: HipA domain-containing protein [Endomicrobiales bacterium]|nr:HipA domain-containing protein [Endomicrobiales bacterium]